MRRDFPKLLALIKVSAYLHQYQGPRIIVDEGEYVIATFADYHIAYTLANKVLRPTLLGLPKGVLKVYDVCKGLSGSRSEITAKTITENCEYSQSTVRHYLNQLIRARLLLRDESQREYRYSVIEEKKAALSSIARLEERFGEKEFRNWLKSMLQNGIKSEELVSYDEIKGNIYTPLPECKLH